MTKKEQILEYFKDINVAYNNSTMLDTLKHMLEDLEEVRHAQWIPITTRPMNEEERLEWAEENGFILEDDDAWVYNSQLPDNGQEVLVCGRYGAVWIDKFMNDPAYGCWLAETGDLDGIVAWMPLPKPYGEEEEDE